jgi:uncharacterized RDD family membrane protein YckC
VELVEHLSDAAEAGELAEALERLGAPEAAAASFARERSLPLAPMDDRLLAAAIDNLPLIAVTITLVIQDVMQGLDSISAMFPPFVYITIGGACISPVPVVVIGQCDVYNGGLLYALGIPLALLWSIVGLGILESHTSTTPGKHLMGLRVVSEAGTRIRARAGVMRRLSFLAGPLAWVDWIPVLWGERRRVLDRLAATKVVAVKAGSQAHGKERPNASDA